MLSDFGSAVRGDQRRNHDAQPNVYRSPEVMLKVNWSYPVDIWNVGVMVCPLDILYSPVGNNVYRCGICLRGSIFSMEMTQMARVFNPGALCGSYEYPRATSFGFAAAWKTKP